MKKNNEGFSVIIALLVIGFLLVLTISVFNMVLRELYDNKGLGNYVKSLAGAESGQELALLSIKKKGYEYYDSIDFSVNDRSVILGANPSDKSKFNKAHEVYIGYDLSTKTNSYSGSLESLGYDIVPLFYSSGASLTEYKTNNISLSISSGDQSDLVWNIVGADYGISGTGGLNINSRGNKKISNSSSEFEFSLEKVGDFLNSSSYNYLVLFNSGLNDIKYDLSSSGGDFIKPKAEIISSASISKYRQNIRTKLDNTEFLNILKYSIYSR